MGSFDRIRLAQDKDVFWTSVTLTTNLAVATNREIAWLTEKLLHSGENTLPTEFVFC